MRKWSLILATSLVAALAVLAPVATAKPATGEADIVSTAAAAGQFTTLASLLQAAGLVDTLKTGGPFTVLAPTDAAFAKVPKATLDALAADPAKLKAVLLYHVISGSVPASEVVKLSSAKTLNGANVAIKVQDGSVFVNGAKVVAPDVAASNGIIHVIDTVLLPPAAAAPAQNIVKTAIAAGQFKTLAALLQKAGLLKTLQSGSWTVFAPTDAAFAKVPKATLAALGKNPSAPQEGAPVPRRQGRGAREQGRDLLRQVGGHGCRRPCEDQGHGGKVFLNGSSRVTKTDVNASNGFIHIINKVLIPSA